MSVEKASGGRCDKYNGVNVDSSGISDNLLR